MSTHWESGPAVWSANPNVAHVTVETDNTGQIKHITIDGTELHNIIDLVTTRADGKPPTVTITLVATLEARSAHASTHETR